MSLAVRLPEYYRVCKHLRCTSICASYFVQLLSYTSSYTTSSRFSYKQVPAPLTTRFFIMLYLRPIPCTSTICVSKCLRLLLHNLSSCKQVPAPRSMYIYSQICQCLRLLLHNLSSCKQVPAPHTLHIYYCVSECLHLLLHVYLLSYMQVPALPIYVITCAVYAYIVYVITCAVYAYIVYVITCAVCVCIHVYGVPALPASLYVCRPYMYVYIVYASTCAACVLGVEAHQDGLCVLACVCVCVCVCVCDM